MKNKSIYYLFLIALIVFLLRIIEVYAAQNQPPFFIPQKVLDDMNNPRKRQLRPDPIGLRVQQQLQAEEKAKAERKRRMEEAQKKRAEEQKQIAEQKTKAEREKQEELAKNQKLQEEIERLKKAEEKRKAQAAQVPEPQKPETLSAETLAKLNAGKTAEIAPSKPLKSLPPAKTKEPVVSATTSEAMQAAADTENPTAPAVKSSSTEEERNSFDAIIADYERDAHGISQGKPVNNPRLRDVLKDYADEWHTL
ncbi:MAG: hypothetical protein IJ770_04000 [Alphaproteobacteria bacterium]|nr:hypothetical protein [Alphaproteobacteria bacterium]